MFEKETIPRLPAGNGSAWLWFAFASLTRQRPLMKKRRPFFILLIMAAILAALLATAPEVPVFDDARREFLEMTPSERRAKGSGRGA